MKTTHFPRPSFLLVLAALVCFQAEATESAKGLGTSVAVDSMGEGSDLGRALLTRLEFEALNLQLIGVANFGGQTTCFIKQQGTTTPQTFQAGQTIGRYKIVAIQNDAVALDRDGFRFWLALEGSRAESDPSVESENEPQLQIADNIQQEINELEGTAAPASEVPGSQVEIKSVSGKLKTRTASFEAGKIVNDGWTVPRSMNGTPTPSMLASAGIVGKGSSGRFAWPIVGRLSSEFGYRRHPMGGGSRMHNGVDIAAAYGSTVRAAAPGVVKETGYNSGLGRYVYIDHGNGYETRYGHLSSVLVESGTRIAQGQAIAREGSTGLSTGPHLHFEVRKDGRPLNPLFYLGK